jgi:formylglycine-generating enzyme required for sulfatase activity
MVVIWAGLHKFLYSGGRKMKRASQLAILTMATFSVSAETLPTIGLQLHARLSITGTVGTVYSVEYFTLLPKTNTPFAKTNIPSTWQCLEFLQLPTNPYLWTDRSTPATGRRIYRAAVFEAPTNMVFIPPGTFCMGCPTNEEDRWDWEGPQTSVMSRHGYWMGKYEVTQGEYLAVVGSNPSYFTTNNGFSQDLTRPVENVTWFDAMEYCTALTQRERAAGRIATNSVYRLPTEAEWEYACRGWTSTRFSYGDDPGYTNLTGYAWYYDNSGGETHPVGQKLPNVWGLHDMHGNVWEWCQDWYGDYSGGIAVDPHGPAAASGADRVIRGGDCGYWFGDARYCRSASRNDICYQGLGDFFAGFRVVLAPSQ